MCENMKPALVVIDMQHYFFRTEERREKLPQLIKSINDLIYYSKEKSIPIYQVVTIHKADRSTWNLVMKKHNFAALIEGSKEAELLPEIEFDKDQILFTKTRQSTFIKTNFEEDLRQRGVDTLILTGVFTHGCVGRTAIDGYQRDFNIILARDACFSHMTKHEEVMFEVIEKEQEQLILSNEQIKELFINGTKEKNIYALDY